MQTNPARQKFWRAVGLGTFLLTAVLLGYSIDRAIHYRSSAEHWPISASFRARVIKTPRISKQVTETFAGVQALPGTPWDLPTALSWSKRELLVFSDGEKVVGLSVDGQLPDEVYSSLVNWGWTSHVIGRKTIIVANNTQIAESFEHHRNIWLLLPIFDGDLVVKQGNQSTINLPYRFSAGRSLDFPVKTEAFTPSVALAMPSDTEFIGSFALPNTLFSLFLPTSVSASFPGLQTLTTGLGSESIDILLGQDEQGMAFAAAIKSPHLTLEQLGAIATEGVSLQNLSTTALTIDTLPNSLEIRGEGNIDVQLNNTDGIDLAIASTTNQSIFRLTQSSEQLILSNRETVIGPISAKYSGNCLRKPRGFLKPQALHEQLAGLNSTTARDVVTYIGESEEVAFSKNWLRICW